MPPTHYRRGRHLQPRARPAPARVREAPRPSQILPRGTHVEDHGLQLLANLTMGTDEVASVRDFGYVGRMETLFRRVRSTVRHRFIIGQRETQINRRSRGFPVEGEAGTVRLDLERHCYGDATISIDAWAAPRLNLVSGERKQLLARALNWAQWLVKTQFTLVPGTPFAVAHWANKKIRGRMVQALTLDEFVELFSKIRYTFYLLNLIETCDPGEEYLPLWRVRRNAAGELERTPLPRAPTSYELSDEEFNECKNPFALREQGGVSTRAARLMLGMDPVALQARRAQEAHFRFDGRTLRRNLGSHDV